MSSYGAKGTRTPDYSLKADVPDGRGLSLDVECPPRFVAGGHRKAPAALHSCGQKRDRPARPVGYHAYPLRSSPL